jgi:membrane associated rhomboid family serine protease
MRSDESRLGRNAAGAVILTISGMLAGLACGLIWAWIGRDDPFRRIGQVVSGGIVGTVIGLALAILLAARERGSFRSVKKTMVFIAAAGVVVWAINTLLRALFFER